MVVHRRNGDPLPELKRSRFLVRRDLCACDLFAVLRKRLCLTPADALFVFAKNQLVAPQTPIRDLHSQYACDDVLQLTYAKENCFG